MANIKFSGLPAASVIGDADIKAISQGGVSKKATELLGKNYVNSGKAGGKTIEGGTLTTETLSLRNNPVDDLGVDINADGILRVNIVNYETLVTDGNDLPNKKYLDDELSLANHWEEGNGFLYPKNSPKSILLSETEAYILADYVLDASSGAYSSISGVANIWQSWTATKDGYLGAIGFAGSPAGQVNHITIYEGNGTGGTVLLQDLNYTFVGGAYFPSAQIELKAGQQYTVLRNYISGGFFGTIGWQFGLGDPYAGGQSSLNATWDMIFSVYIYERYTELDMTGIKSNDDITIDANKETADSIINLINSNSTYDAKVQINGTGAINEISNDPTFAAVNTGQLVDAQSIKQYISSTIPTVTLNSSAPTNSYYFSGLEIDSDGKTAFTISKAPENNESFRLYWNGQLAIEGVDYTLVGTVLTWIGASLKKPVTPNGFDEFTAVINTIGISLGSTREIIIAATDYNANLGNFRTRDIGGTGAHRFTGSIPSDALGVVSMELIGAISSGAAGSAKDIDLSSDYGAEGELYNVHTESDTTTTYDFTGKSNVITYIDVKNTVFSAIAPGDFFGLFVDHKGIGGSIDYIGFKLVINT